MLNEERFYELTIVRNPFEEESDIEIDFDTLEEAKEFSKKIIFQDPDLYNILIYEIGKDSGYIYNEL